MRVGWNPYYKPPPGSQVNEEHPIANGLVRCYLMNEGKGATKVSDLTRNSGVAGFTGTPDWTASNEGWALNFNGTDENVFVDWSGSDYGVSGLTIITHCQRIGEVSGAWKSISGCRVDKGGAPGGFYYHINRKNAPDANTVSFSWYGTDESTADDCSSGEASATGWHQLSATVGASNVKIYIDAVQKNSVARTKAFWAAGAVLEHYIACGWYNVAADFSSIDVAYHYVWNRELSAAEIAQVYRQPYCFIRASGVERRYFYNEAAPATSTFVPAHFKPPRSTQIDTTHPMARDLVSYWLMNEGTGNSKTYDLTRNNNHATLTNIEAASDWKASERGWVLDFDGTDEYADIGDIGDLGTTYTVAAQVKFDSVSGSEDGVVCCYRSDTSEPIAFQLDQDDDDLKFTVCDDAATTATATKADCLNATDWFQVVGVRDGNDIAVYVNTESPATGSAAFGALTMNKLAIAALFSGTYQKHFDGRIAFVALWKRALSAEEIAHLYHQPYCFFGSSRQNRSSLSKAGARLLLPPAEEPPEGRTYVTYDNSNTRLEVWVEGSTLMRLTEDGKVEM